MQKNVLLQSLLCIICVSGTLIADYTSPARIEEEEKKIKPADDERSGDKEKAKDKQRRYEETEHKIKNIDDETEGIAKAEYPTESKN